MNIEDYNYYGDSRVVQALRNKGRLNMASNTLTIDITCEDEDGCLVETTATFPVKYCVCLTCEGRGSHVNPSIDAGGISSYEFDEDPSFREDYFSGMYDVSCYGCDGNRLVPVPDEGRCTLEQLKQLRAWAKEEMEYARERARELRYGY